MSSIRKHHRRASTEGKQPILAKALALLPFPLGGLSLAPLADACSSSQFKGRCFKNLQVWFWFFSQDSQAFLSHQPANWQHQPTG